MGHTTASSTVRIPVCMHYICSKCGEEVIFNHVVEAKKEASESVLFVKETTQKDLENEALQSAKAAAGKKLGQICLEIENGRYDSAEFHCSCPHCSHQEPWSKLRFSRVESILRNLFWIILLLSLVSLWFAAIYAGLLAVWFLYKAIHRRRIYQQIDILPAVSRPKYYAPAGADQIPSPDDKHRVRENYPFFRAAFRSWYSRWAESKLGQISTEEEAVEDFIKLLETCATENGTSCLYLCQDLFFKDYTFCNCFADMLMEQLYALKLFPTEENQKKIITTFHWLAYAYQFSEGTVSYHHLG